MIRVTHAIVIDPRDIEEVFIRASGPGGQNVNKVSTAVQLRFNLVGATMPDEVRARLVRLAGKRLSQEGVLLITARRHRTQERNRADALEALIELIRRAAVRPVKRVPTRPTLASKQRRVEAKTLRGSLKRSRAAPEREG